MLGWQHRPAAARGSRARGSAHAPIFKSHWNAQHAARQQPRSTGRDQCQQQETCSTSNGSAHSGDWDVQRFMHVLKQRREAGETSHGTADASSRVPGRVILLFDTASPCLPAKTELAAACDAVWLSVLYNGNTICAAALQHPAWLPA